MKKTTYTEAFEELKAIVQEMEDGDIGVDELSDKVKRAAVLIRICKNKLHQTEEDVQKILRELEESDNSKQQQ
ncbi:MAG: exodeoxyribonuclease VII small subunit [Bacteroidales bacterium]|nr:exodeoxyribonuclease VII small subunit [Bacteroidales bacterium]